uniref:Uncharacterized protein n=1 Tax=Rhizophagus irregularis (strain DAOM 181602 / DAOM 197198 / MUCL 43194) TaxID=747089 RepID=U9UZ12_RHIID
MAVSKISELTTSQKNIIALIKNISKIFVDFHMFSVSLIRTSKDDCDFDFPQYL